jgi:hypothetical protein
MIKNFQKKLKNLTYDLNLVCDNRLDKKLTSLMFNSIFYTYRILNRKRLWLDTVFVKF